MTDNTDPNADKHGIVLPERAYDLLKDLDLIALPALGAAFGGIGTLYGIDDKIVGIVVGTIAVVVTLIGILLKISNVQYNAKKQVQAALAAPNVVINNPPQSPAPSVAADPDEVIVTGGSQ